MKRSSEKELRHIISRGDITAQKAVELAAAQGFLAVGTALSQEGHAPGSPWNRSPLVTDGEFPTATWGPLITNERGGTFPIIRACTVGSTAVWAAYGGDVNERFQRSRIGLPLLPENNVYDLGSYGWRYNERTRRHRTIGHADLLDVGHQLYQLDPSTIIGATDFLADDGSFTVSIPGEPGHYASPHQHDTVATRLVRIGDVQAEFAHTLTAPMDYEPMQL